MDNFFTAIALGLLVMGGLMSLGASISRSSAIEMGMTPQEYYTWVMEVKNLKK